MARLDANVPNSRKSGGPSGSKVYGEMVTAEPLWMFSTCLNDRVTMMPSLSTLAGGRTSLGGIEIYTRSQDEGIICYSMYAM